MKKIFLYSALVATTVGGASCSDFLDVQPVGSVSEVDFLTHQGVSQVLTDLYATLHNTWYFEATLTNYAYGDVMGGQANKGSSFTDQPDFTSLETYTFTTDNSYLLRKWRSCYNGVFCANNLINITNKTDLEGIPGQSKDYSTETIAQARFFRGFWHFEAVKLFGATVPYVSDEDMAANVNPQVSNVDESGNYIYIWDKIIDDFQYAYDNLPETWPNMKGNVNKWAAGAFLAKVKAYQSSPYNGKNASQNRWVEVKSLIEEIMTNGKDSKGTKYKLADTYEELWTAGVSDWTGESIFDIQMAISGTQTNTNAPNGSKHIGFLGALGVGGWSFLSPSYEMVNSHIVDADGLPLLDGSYKNEAPLTTLDESLVPHTDLTVYTDPRLDVTTGRFNTPYLDWSIPTTISGWIREVSNAGPYLHKKCIPNKADKGSLSVTTSPTSSAKNFHLMRYADLLLLYAEALIETGDHQGAREYINQIRSRAANYYLGAKTADMEPTSSTYVFEDKVNGKTDKDAAANYRIGLYPESQFASKEGALAALRFERKIELGLEGHRWYDLARWGIISEELNDYCAYESQYLKKYVNKTYGATWFTLPIPQNQIQLMDGLLVQNENWK